MAVLFDAAADKLSRTTSLPAFPCTMMGWFIMDAGGGAWQTFLSYGGSTGSYASLSYSGTGLIIWDGGGATSGSAIGLSAWMHLAFVMGEPVGSAMSRGYLNGVLDVTDTNVADGVTAAKLWIGTDNDNDAFQGRAAGVKIWSGVELTAAEIAQEMRCYLPLRTANLHAWYPLLSTADDEVDYSGNGRTLTVEGTLTTADGPPIPWSVSPVRRWYSLGAPPAPTPSTPVLAGGRFAATYPAFLEQTAESTFAGYVQAYAGLYHNPIAWAQWVALGQDLRILNPTGMYLKHINVRTIRNDSGGPAEGHPDYDYVKNNHPEWIIYDNLGNPVDIFPPGEATDFANDAYLDWVFDVWMPTMYLDTNDDDPNLLTWYLHDNGNFDALAYTPDTGDPISVRYATDEGVRTAWEHFLDRWHAKWPNKRILISSGTVTYKSVAEQMAVFQRIYSHADGFFGETLTSDYVYWNTQPTSGWRIAMQTEMQLASWLADNDKSFFPNIGMRAGAETDQAEMDYAWAFFNIMRKGDWQFFARVTKDGFDGNWVPRRYAEMDRTLGTPLEDVVEVSTDVYRRTFTNSISYVNLSDTSANLTLPAGTYETSLGVPVASPLVLPSFRGLTIYSLTPLSYSTTDVDYRNFPKFLLRRT